jgi:hypothetical protein
LYGVLVVKRKLGHRLTLHFSICSVVSWRAPIKPQ